MDSNSASEDDFDERNTIWFEHPADTWLEALPIGNGRLGGMVFGTPSEERVQFNEESLWAGANIDHNNPEALENLPTVRNLLFEGNHEEALDHIKDGMLADPPDFGPYQTFGDIELDIPSSTDYEEYSRSLNLPEGITQVSYTVDETRWSREYFISAVDDVFVLNMANEGEQPIDASVTLSREIDAQTSILDDNTLRLQGQNVSFQATESSSPEGLEFVATLDVLTDAGSISSEDESLRIKADSEVTIILTAATSHNLADPNAHCDRLLSRTRKHTYEDLRQRHVNDHRKMFGRVDLDLGTQTNAPTNKRLAAAERGNIDPGLAALQFQYGRYLLMDSSRPGGLPANLQGVWCEDLEPPWDSDYHFDVNLQMNYWPVDVCNLSESVEPLLDYLDMLREQGEKTAKVHYDCEGFVIHMTSNLWGCTAPNWWGGVWPTGAAWLCQNLWDHYQFTGDKSTLAEKVYPIMREAARFLIDYLVEDESGHLVTNPSVSPENFFITDDGQRGMYCISPTMDNELIAELLENCIEAEEILGIDDGISEEAQVTLNQLPARQIGEYGQLQEWREDYQEFDPGHRHLSHLVGFHPGNSITLRDTPELADAVRKSLERRVLYGRGDVGWFHAWLINHWARLEEPDLALKHTEELLSTFTRSNLFTEIGPWVADEDPIFQIDANLGFTAGVAEMLIQSHAGEISLLPALPKKWSQGSVSGLRGRGGFEIDMWWEDRRLQRVEIHSEQGNQCKIRVHHNEELHVAEVQGSSRVAEDVEVDMSDDVVSLLETNSGETIILE